MTRHVLFLAGMCCALALSPASRGEPPAPKLTAKYRLEFEIRKPGSPRTFTVDAFHAGAGHFFYATSVGVLAPSGKVLFVPGEGGTEAVALFNGKSLWLAEGTGEPLLATADHVFAQVQVKGKPKQVKLAVLDATTGERVRTSDAIEFPDWVSVPREYGRSFRSAARLDNGDVLFVWEARTFSEGGPPPPDPDPNAKKASGAFRLEVKTGRVTAVKDYKPKDEEFVDTLGTKTRVNGWAFWVEAIPAAASATGERHTVLRVLKAERADRKGSWKHSIAGAVHLLPRP